MGDCPASSDRRDLRARRQALRGGAGPRPRGSRPRTTSNSTRWAQNNASTQSSNGESSWLARFPPGSPYTRLIAAAADPRTSPEQALAVDEVYLSICALTTLLDGLVDHEQDMSSTGNPGTSATTRITMRLPRDSRP